MLFIRSLLQILRSASLINKHETNLMPSPIKIAFIGAGSMAAEHARAFAALPDVELVGIHSRTRQKAEALAEKFGIAGVYDSVAELREKSEADLVVIAVNELGLVPVMREAVEHDWTMLLEKPAGYNLAVADEVRQMVKDADRTAYVGLNRRYYSATRQALEALADCGEGPRYITVADQQSFTEARAVGHPEEVVRHMMYANSIHLIDYMRVFGRGEIDRVEQMQPWHGEDSVMQAATVFFSSGDIARYEAHWKGPGPWACTVTCAAKRLEMRPLETLTVQMAGTRRAEPVDIEPVDSEYKAGFLRQAEDTVSALRGEPNILPSLDEAYRTMELIHAIYGI